MMMLMLLLGSIHLSLAQSCFPTDIFKKYTTVAKAHDAQYGFGMAVINKSTARIECQQSANSEEVIYPASSMKVFVVAAVLRMIDAGKLSLDQTIKITQSNADTDCGGPCGKWRLGSQRPLKELIAATIIESNNITTNQLMDLAGKSTINQTAQDFGTYHTKISRKVYVDVDPEPEIKERNGTTVRDFIQFYQELYFNQKKLLSANLRTVFLNLLKSTQHNNRLNLHFQDHFDFYHKTGSTSRSASDAGFLIMKDHLVIMAGLQESPKAVTGGRWDFTQLSEMGKEIVENLDLP